MFKQELKKDILQWIENNEAKFFEVADELWQKPELGMEEYNSSKALVALLESSGFQVETGIVGMPTAFVASYGKGEPVIGFSSEYDALPGLSQKWESNHHDPVRTGAPGHGCGHNLIGTAGIFGAVSLKAIMEKENLTGTIKVFGTPAEELCIGKPFMARAGLFKGIDAFLDWHPSHLNRAGSCDTNAYFNIKYHFKGKTAHGNAPWLGRSSLDAGMLMGHAIEILREHIKPGTLDSPSTLNYAFPDVGNGFPNVVPDRTTLWCIGRMRDAELAAEVIARVNNCAEGAAIATETTVEKEVITATHDMIPNLRLAYAVDENLRWIGAPDFTLEEQNDAKEIQKSMGVPQTGFSGDILPVALGSQPVTDSSEYSWFAPIALFNIALSPSAETGWHSWTTTRFAGSSHGKKVLTTAAKVLAATGYDLLTKPEIINEAKEELKGRLKGRVYETLLSIDAKPDLMINRDAMEKYR